MNAVVSGASGFLGRHLAHRLLKAGMPVLGLDVKSPPFNREGYRHVQSSIDRCEDEIASHLQHGGVYYHMAGLADIKQCEERPTDAFSFNVSQVFTALLLCERIGDVRFVLPSTGIVYGLLLNRPATEDDPVHPISVYTGSKLAAEMLVRSFTPIRIKKGAVIARLSNVYGPGASNNTVLGRLLGQIARRESLHVYDQGPVRDFIYLEDAVEALVRLSWANIEGTLIVNVSSGMGVSIEELVDTLSRMTGLPADEPQGMEKSNNDYLVLNNTRLQREIHWIPMIKLQEGLTKCLEGLTFSNRG